MGLLCSADLVYIVLCYTSLFCQTTDTSASCIQALGELSVLTICHLQLAQRELEMQRQENLQQIISVYDQPLVRNTEMFTCPICFEEIQPGSGIMLRDCLHVFCE